MAVTIPVVYRTKTRCYIDNQHIVDSGIHEDGIGAVLGYEILVGHVGAFGHPDRGGFIDFLDVVIESQNVVIIVHGGGGVEQEMVSAVVLPDGLHDELDRGFFGVAVLADGFQDRITCQHGQGRKQQECGKGDCPPELRFEFHKILVLLVLLVASYTSPMRGEKKHILLRIKNI